VGKPGGGYGDRVYTARGNSWMAQQQLAQEDYADAGPRTNSREYPTYLSETRAHMAGRLELWLRPGHGRCQRQAGGLSISRRTSTLWLVGGKRYARAAGLGSSRNSCETQSALMERRDPAGYREAALKQLWGEAYNGSDG